MKYIIAISLLSIGLIIAATEPKTQPSALFTSDAVTRSVERGLAYLKQTQQPNGSWICKVGYKLNDSYIGTDNENVAVTALSGIAFMAQGNLPGRGKYGLEVSKAVDFILSCARDTDGYITKHGSRMYEHAFATLFLAEVYGMSPREDIKNKLKKATYLIVASQNNEGGWRYQPAPIDADISVTVTTVQALRAARNIGISVPKETIDNAISYIKKCSRQDGRFEYQLPTSRYGLALTAAGVTALMSAGEYDAPEVKRGLTSILDALTKPNNPDRLTYGDYHYFYAHYYSVQAMHHAGGQYWDTYLSLVQSDLLPRQLPDGSWIDDVGKPYATSMACIILQVENDYLPIIQK
ncbi:MAG: prenyltransferase/squalene oxidase repeat-containing protein [Planctomycetota bacterium]